MTRLHAAPRRSKGLADGAATLGDAPILLNLPSLCGVPDPEDDIENGSAKEASFQDASHAEDNEESAARADSPDFKPAKPAGHGKSATTAPADGTKEAGKKEAVGTDRDTEAQPSSASGVGERTQEDLWTPPAPKSNVHRNIIVGTAIFVIAAAGLMYVNRDQEDAEQVAAPAVDVDMGWELEGEDFPSDITDPAATGPAYGAEFQAPPLEGSTKTEAEETPINVAPLPSLNEAASRDFEIQRVGGSGDYPTTSTPDAAYVAENPAAGAPNGNAAPAGNSPMTPQEAPHDQPY